MPWTSQFRSLYMARLLMGGNENEDRRNVPSTTPLSKQPKILFVLLWSLVSFWRCKRWMLTKTVFIVRIAFFSLAISDNKGKTVVDRRSGKKIRIRGIIIRKLLENATATLLLITNAILFCMFVCSFPSRFS